MESSAEGCLGGVREAIRADGFPWFEVRNLEDGPLTVVFDGARPDGGVVVLGQAKSENHPGVFGADSEVAVVPMVSLRSVSSRDITGIQGGTIVRCFR